MFEEIKELLIQEPQHIINLLELYGFCKISLRAKEIRCAYDNDKNPSSIVIRLQDNDKLMVKDYARNILDNDLMGYICTTRCVELKDVLQAIKQELGIESFYKPVTQQNLFGGIFDHIGKGYSEIELPVINENVLNEYGKTPCFRFLRDGISFETQEKFGIGYSVQDQRITIPIRNAYGELIGVKGRCNYEPAEYEPKYLYLYPCMMSQTLYGYSENYEFMYGNEVYVFESEKSVMQAYTMGFRKAVALGSNSLSDAQAKLIMSLSPKTVVFVLDNNLPLENTIKNINKLLEWDTFKTVKIKYFDWTSCSLLDEKDSPTDKGKSVFEEIIRKDLKDFES